MGLQDKVHGRHGADRRGGVAFGELGVGIDEAFEEVGFVFASGDAIQGGANGAALTVEHVAVFAGGHGVLPEDLFAAFCIADELGGVVFVFEDEFAELHVVEVDVAFADVEEVDAGFLAVLAVEDDFHFGPVLVAADFRRGFGAADVVVEAGFATEGMGFDPGAQAVFGVRFERHIGEVAGVRVVARDAAHGAFAAVDHLRIGDKAPLRAVVAFLLRFAAVVAAGPGGADGGFKAGIGEQIGAFLVVQGLVLLAEHLRGLGEPFVAFDDGISGELFDERLDLRRGGKVGELHERGEARVQIGIGDDAGAEEEVLRGFVIAKGADGVAAKFGVFGDEGGLVGFGIEGA